MKLIVLRKYKLVSNIVTLSFIRTKKSILSEYNKIYLEIRSNARIRFKELIRWK